MRRTILVSTGTLALVALAVLAMWHWGADGSARYRYRYEITPGSASRRFEPATFEKRLAQTTATPFDWVDLAGMYLTQARRDDDPQALARAKELVDQAEAKLPETPGAALVYAGIADATHRFSDALRFAQTAWKQTGGAGAASLLSTASLAQGNVDEALRWADLAVRRRPQSGTYFVRALALAARGRDDEATFDFDRAVALEEAGDPLEGARMRAVWGRIRWRQGHRRDARALAREALRIAPQSVAALALKSEIALVEDPSSAVADYREAFRLSRRPKFLAGMARALRAEGRIDDADRARSEAERLLRTDVAKETGHRLELVEVLLDRGDKLAAEEARELLRAELEVRRSPEVYTAVARAEELAGRPESALAAAHEALRAGFPDVMTYAHVARLERKAGNPMRAEIYAAKASGAEAPFLPKAPAGAR